MTVDYALLPETIRRVDAEPIAAAIVVGSVALGAMDVMLAEWPVVRVDDNMIHCCIADTDHFIVRYVYDENGARDVFSVEQYIDGNGKIAFVRNVADTMEV